VDALDVIDTPTRHELPERQTPPVCVIVHATGETDLDRCLDWYTDARGSNTDGIAPHYLVTATGSIRRIVDEGRVARHAAMRAAEAAAYRQGWETWSRCVWSPDDRVVDLGVEQPRYRLWRETWRRTVALQSPLELVSGDSPNRRSIGIEVQSLERPPRGDVFEPQQYQALAALLADVCKRWRIPLDREHVLGHYDVSPLRRANAGGSFDPGERFNWSRLWDLCR
jgi:N-acetyl-anhydromuramyl-L-alanine amidase AmpD